MRRRRGVPTGLTEPNLDDALDADEADLLEQRSTESGVEDAATYDLTGRLVVSGDVDEAADALDQQRDAEPDDPGP